MPEAKGFDTSEGFLGACVDYHTLQTAATAFPCQGVDAWGNGAPMRGAPSRGSSLHLQNEEIVRVISTHKSKHGAKPLFLYAALQAMHSPKPAPGFNLHEYPKLSSAFALANGLIT